MRLAHLVNIYNPKLQCMYTLFRQIKVPYIILTVTYFTEATGSTSPFHFPLLGACLSEVHVHGYQGITAKRFQNIYTSRLSSYIHRPSASLRRVLCNQWSKYVQIYDQ
jgi:hypothetical protein